VIPNYDYYPSANSYEQMIQVGHVLSWVYNNIIQFGGDPKKVVLCGHSSGAHIATLLCIHLVQNYISPSIVGIICLSGVYDIRKHYLFERQRLVSEISPLKTSNGLEVNFDRFSPALLIPQLSPQQVLKLPPFLLLHGKVDDVVPVNASIEFHSILQKAGATSSLHLEDGNHTGLIMDLMLGHECPSLVIMNNFVADIQWRAVRSGGSKL